MKVIWLKDSRSSPGNDHCFIYHAGHVGAPMPCNLIKLVDVEEMNYLASKGEGEVSDRPPPATLFSHVAIPSASSAASHQCHVKSLSLMLLVILDQTGFSLKVPLCGRGPHMCLPLDTAGTWAREHAKVSSIFRPGAQLLSASGPGYY